MLVKFHDGVTIVAKDALVLARLSKKVPGRAQIGITTQDEDAREHAGDYDLKVIATVADHSSGAKSIWTHKNAKPWVTQPDLMAKYQVIIVSDLTRLTREAWIDAEKIVQWSEESHILILVVNKGVRWPPRYGTQHEDDDVSAWNREVENARREWSATSRRYKRMHRGKREAGDAYTKPFYGYGNFGRECGKCPCLCNLKNVDDAKEVRILQAEADEVLWMVSVYRQGWPLQRICDDLMARQIPAPGGGKTWWPATVASILRSPSIAGRRYPMIKVGPGGKEYPDETKPVLETYDPIIDWDTHRVLVALLDSKANRKGISPANAYMLTSIISDANGHSMPGIKGGRRNQFYYYYCRQSGCNFMARLDLADKEVNNAVIDTYGEWPHFVQRVIPGGNNFDRIDRLRQDRTELDGQIDQASDPAPYEAKRDELTAEIRRLIREDEESPKADTITWVDSGETIKDRWQAFTVAQRRDWLLKNGWKVTVIKDAEDPRGWRLAIDSGWMAEIGLERQAESLGFPVSAYWRALAALPEALGIPPVEPQD